MATPPLIGARPALAALAVASTLALSCFAFVGSAGAAPAVGSDIAPVAVAGGFADAYGLAVDADLLAGAVPVVIPPVARASSSCPAAKAPSINQALSAGDPMVARVQVLTSGTGATCTAAAPIAMAKSQLVNVDALGAAAPIAIHADAITAISNSDCATAPNGSVNIVNLTVGGKQVTPDGPVPPNTRVADPALAALGLTVILNEQNPASPGRGFVVNGIHIIAAAQGASLPIGGKVVRGDIVISHAVSGVACVPTTTSPSPSPTTPPPPLLPAVTFTKVASQDIAKIGDTFSYAATVTNTSTTPCEVLRLIDHVATPFSVVSSDGAFGSKLDTPTVVRPGDGPDAVLRPVGLVIAPKQTLAQTFTVTVNAEAVAGTYYDTLELFCAPNGDFISGPLAPVTIVHTECLCINPSPPVVSATPTPTPTHTVIGDPPYTCVEGPGVSCHLPHTGGSPLIALGALGLLATGVAARKFLLS